MTVILATVGILAFGWFLNQCAPALDAHAQRQQEREDRMLARMTKRQRRGYYRAEHYRATHSKWGL